jgi:hypothetical protein
VNEHEIFQKQQEGKIKTDSERQNPLDVGNNSKKRRGKVLFTSVTTSLRWYHPDQVQRVKELHARSSLSPS